MAKLKTFESSFDTYTYTGVIGEGGAGYVYAVTNSNGEELALKVLKPKGITSERLRRFKNEIAFCSAPPHQNIVRVIDNDSSCRMTTLSVRSM